MNQASKRHVHHIAYMYILSTGRRDDSSTDQATCLSRPYQEAIGMAADNPPTSLPRQGDWLHAPSDSSIGSCENDEAAMLRAARCRRADELDSVDTEIVRLKAVRTKLRLDLQALDVLLGEATTLENPIKPSTEITPPSNVLRQGSYGQRVRLHQPSELLSASVTAVMEVLQESGPLHYRKIYEKVADAGITIPGKDPAATLLSRFSRDPRVERVSAGTYRIIPDVVSNDAN